MEKHVGILNETIRLAGMIEENDGQRAVVVTHPHPLYGGNMDNPVVLRIVESFASAGFTTLRFNFRGTGGSTGMFDNGQGEQTDVVAVLDFLKAQGATSLVLAGYSFGARINAAVVAGGVAVADHVMVSPPVGFMSFDDISALPHTGFVLTGQHDEIAPPKMIQTHLNRWRIDPRFDVIPGCDHFYSGCLNDLGMILSEYIAESER